MRIDYDRVIGEVRIHLHEPDPHSPTDDLIMLKAGDDAQLLMNQMSAAPPGWSQRYYDLTASPGEGQHLIPADHFFSKPVRVHTIDSTNRNHVTRKITCCERQNIDEFYRGQTQALYGKHSAEVMVFWQEGPAHYVEIIPEQIEAATYRIWYNTGAIEDPRRGGDAPVPGEYFRFLVIKTALSTLPYASWTGLPADQQAAKMKALGEGLLKKEMEYAEQWERFLLTNRVLGNTEPQGYAEWYMDQWF